MSNLTKTLKIEIVNKLGFTMTNSGDFGVCTCINDASKKWCEKEYPVRNDIGTNRIQWKDYTGSTHDSILNELVRPTIDQIKRSMERYPILQNYAMNMGFIVNQNKTELV